MPWAEKLITSHSNDIQAPTEGRVLSYVDALNEALTMALDLDPKVLILSDNKAIVEKVNKQQSA